MDGGPGISKDCAISSGLLAPPPPTLVFNFSIVSCTYEVIDNQLDNYEVEIQNLHLDWIISNEPNASLNDIHFQIWLSFDPTSKSAQDVYEIVNVSSSVGKVNMLHACKYCTVCTRNFTFKPCVCVCVRACV